MSRGVRLTPDVAEPSASVAETTTHSTRSLFRLTIYAPRAPQPSHLHTSHSQARSPERAHVSLVGGPTLYRCGGRVRSPQTPPRGPGRGLQLACAPLCAAFTNLKSLRVPLPILSPLSISCYKTFLHVSLTLTTRGPTDHTWGGAVPRVTTTYTWHLSHAAWNQLMHALHGNTPTNPAPSTVSYQNRTKSRPL